MEKTMAVLDVDDKQILNLKDVALFLNISLATVRNWMKSGSLIPISDKRDSFYLKEIQELKIKIKDGRLKKLNSRANKIRSERTFVPYEYLNVDVGGIDFDKTISFINENNIRISITLFLLCCNLLKKEKIIKEIDIEDFLLEKDIISNNKQINEELVLWRLEFSVKEFKREYSVLLNCKLPNQKDALGFIYQTLLLEGKKSENGSYYTPEYIVDEITEEYAKGDLKVLDPCCGTGQFLLSFSDKIKDPRKIYGVDIDAIAVKIARLNVLMKYRDEDFDPNIFCKNMLFESGVDDLFNLENKDINNFDVIATNPPWGVHFSKKDVDQLKICYPQIHSLESFSYFLKKSIDFLKDKGIVSFILPESILNVKTHRDIREFLLRNVQIKKIVYLGRVFRNVFTPVVRLDLIKKEGLEKIDIINTKETYQVLQSRWKDNQDFIFNIHANVIDMGILDKVYKGNNINLKNNADWVLGIVTGNNNKYIVNKKRKNYEPIYKGKDIDQFMLRNPSNYIFLNIDSFQQVAPIEKFYVKEKLIYKFISKNLILAYDDKQSLTLNSANSVIPKISNYPMKCVLALFNSSLYQFIFQKKFSSIKVLRSHLEQMPLPLWSNSVLKHIVSLVDKIIYYKSDCRELDMYIFEKFNLSRIEKRRVVDCIA